MEEGLSLVTDLAVILIAAGVFTIIFKALKQPLILGYIIAGFIVGPHLGLFDGITKLETVSQWSEIGIIFLLFELGLEFSFKKLIKVGSAAITMAGTKCIGMFLVGIIAGKAFGWTTMEGIFLGGLMSMSSTTIIIKTYDDLGLKKKPWAPVIFGSLVVEDLIAVLLMVLLSTLAVSNRFAGKDMVFALGKLVFFIVLCFLVGIYVIPTLFNRTRKWLSDEILLLVSIGLCFGMVVLASAAGFSSALGAFIMGSLMAETVESERIVKLSGSLKNMFGAIFFVSVGMMVDPAVIGQYWKVIIIITIVAMAGILFFSTLGGLLAGEGLENSVHAGFSLAQLGEFAFIIASLGCSLGVMREFIYPVVIAVSVITTFTTPYMIKAGAPAAAWLQRVLPAKVLATIDAESGVRHVNNAAEQSEWKNYAKIYGLRVGLYTILLLAVVIASNSILKPLVGNMSLPDFVKNLICCGITLTAILPFAGGLTAKSDKLSNSAHRLIKSHSGNRWAILSLFALRFFLAYGFISYAIISGFGFSIWTVLAVLLMVIPLILFGRSRSRSLEARFFSNLNERENLEKAAAPVTSSLNSQMAGFDIHIEALKISPDSDLAGKQLRQMPFRHTTGVNIVKITRGSRSILIPGGDEIIFPGDRLLAVGSSEQIENFRNLMEQETHHGNGEDAKFVVKKLVLEPDSLFVGKSLRELSLRNYTCMVVSVLHDGKFITNPSPDYAFSAGDTIWFAGEENGVNRCIS